MGKETVRVEKPCVVKHCRAHTPCCDLPATSILWAKDGRMPWSNEDSGIDLWSDQERGNATLYLGFLKPPVGLASF